MADFTQLEADAKALGAKLLADAKNGIVTALQAAETDSTTAVPVLDTDVEAVLLDFVPSAFRSIVQGFLAGAKSQLDTIEQNALKTGFAIAITRIEALL